eukprot:scaffold6817_cov114-Cylindrotheca_fusiformis.AAC.2
MATLTLHSICELEPGTDVVCDGGYKSLLHSEVFMQVLRGHSDEYERASKYDRPIVSLRILEYWRKQQNGRFVKYDDRRNLWDDIGDKKSRQFISKALKQIARSSSLPPDEEEEEEELDREVTPSSTDEHTESTASSSQSTSTRSPLLTPSLTRVSDRAPNLNRIPDRGPLHKRVSASVQENAHRKQHLYGRSKEEDDLADLYRNSISAGSGPPDFLLLTGDGGVGKTTLARSLKSRVLQDNGFYAEVKFENLALDDSLAAYITVFNDVCNNILSMQNKNLQNSYIAKITKLMEHLDGTLATSIVPALGRILELGSSSKLPYACPVDMPSVDEESEAGEKSKENHKVPVIVSFSSARLKFFFYKTLRSIVSEQCPLVILLDDIHYAPSVAACQDFLMEVLSHREGLFAVATSRSGSPTTVSLGQFVASLQNRDLIRLHSWGVQSLEPAAVHELMADTLALDATKLELLSSDLFALTGGNPLFLLELLRSFQEDDILRYDASSDQWKCDDHLLAHHPLRQVQSLGKLYSAKVLELPKSAQETLKLASVLGPCFSEDLVARVSKSKDYRGCLQAAIEAGLLIRNDEYTVAFRHDSIHTATYGLIPDEEKSAVALQLGRRLWRKVSKEDINEYSFDIIRLLFHAKDELFEKSSPADLTPVIELCLNSSRNAAKTTGFHSSIFFVEFGLQVLGKAGMWKENYDLCLALHNNAVDVYYGVGQLDEVDKYVEEILVHAKRFEHTVQARMMHVYTLGTRKQVKEALNYGVETLSLLGEPIPAHPTAVEVAIAVSHTKRRLSKKSDASLLRLPTLTDEKKLAVMMTLQVLQLSTSHARPFLSIIISCRIIDITVIYGACAVSAVGFGAFGVAISRGGRHVEEGLRFGRNSLAFAKKFGGGAWECRSAAAVYGCINIWREPIRQCFHQSKKAYLLGLGSGDLEYAVLNASLLVFNSMETLPINTLDGLIRMLSERMVSLDQEKSLVVLKPIWQMLQNFLGCGNTNPTVLRGKCLTPEDLTDTEALEYNFGLLNSVRTYEMVLCYHFSDIETAESCLKSAELVYENVISILSAFARMYHALVLLANAKKSDWRRIRKVRRHLKVMRGWSKSCPENFLGKQFLVEAELAAVLKKTREAQSKYYLAIIQSRDSGILMQEALANERAGKFCASIGEKQKAMKHLNEALRLYKAWGATAKCEHLEAEMRLRILCLTGDG